MLDFLLGHTNLENLEIAGWKPPLAINFYSATLLTYKPSAFQSAVKPLQSASLTSYPSLNLIPTSSFSNVASKASRTSLPLLSQSKWIEGPFSRNFGRSHRLDRLETEARHRRLSWYPLSESWAHRDASRGKFRALGMYIWLGEDVSNLQSDPWKSSTFCIFSSRTRRR